MTKDHLDPEQNIDDIHQQSPINPSLTWIVKFNKNNQGQFSMTLDSVPISCIADSGSCRSLISNFSLSRIKGDYYMNLLEKKPTRKILDANGKSLKVLGAIMLHTRIGENFSANIEYYCFHGTNETCLLGFYSMRDLNIVIYPRVGLFQCKSSADDGGDMCLHIQGARDQKVLLEEQTVLFPAVAVQDYWIDSGHKMDLKVKVLLPALSEQDRKTFLYEHLVFHSESIQKDVPIHKLNIYFQYSRLDHNYKAQVRYINHARSPASIESGQIICHAQMLQSATREQIDSSDDNIAKHIRSIFTPDLIPGDPPDHQERVGEADTKVRGRPQGPHLPCLSADHTSSPGLACAAVHGNKMATTGQSSPPSLLTTSPSTKFSYSTKPHELKIPENISSTVRISSQDQSEIDFIHKTLDTYKNAVSKSEFDCGRYLGEKMFFTVKQGTQSYHARSYPIPISQKKECDRLISMLMEAGIIQHTTTVAKIISNIHFVFKNHPLVPDHLADYPGQRDTSKPRNLRIVVDHRFLNSVVDMPSRFVQTPIPILLRRLHNSNILGSADLRASFFAIECHESVLKYLNFEYDNKLFQFLRCPQGHIISSFALSAALRQMQHKHNLINTEVFCDDIIFHAKTAPEYKKVVQKFFHALSCDGFKVNPSKCLFWERKSISILGYLYQIQCRSLIANPQKVKHIAHLKSPKTRTELKRILGVANFLSEFIYGLQTILAPLHKLASTKVRFIWTHLEESALTNLKRSIASLPALRLPSPHLPLQLWTDASPAPNVRGYVWLWTQKYPDGRSYIIQFGSKSVTKEQMNFSQAEAEIHCVICALTRDVHLTNFTSVELYTDCRSITFLNVYMGTQTKLHRWKLFLDTLCLKLIFVRSTSNCIRVCDLLGRTQDQVLQKLAKVKKPKKGDIDDMPQFCFDNIQPLPFQDAFELISSLIKYHKENGIHQSHLPLMYNAKGRLAPLGKNDPPSPLSPSPSPTPHCRVTGGQNTSHFRMSYIDPAGSTLGQNKMPREGVIDTSHKFKRGEGGGHMRL